MWFVGESGTRRCRGGSRGGLAQSGEANLVLGDIAAALAAHGRAVELDDVIGLDAAKREIVALTARLTQPHRQLAIPRGILLSGPPGCGKTMLARALTNRLDGGECRVPARRNTSRSASSPTAIWLRQIASS